MFEIFFIGLLTAAVIAMLLWQWWIGALAEPNASTPPRARFPRRSLLQERGRLWAQARRYTHARQTTRSLAPRRWPPHLSGNGAPRPGAPVSRARPLLGH